jgi:hypothetical protein
MATMLFAVDFNNEPSPQACKVRDVWSDRRLLPEMRINRS